MTDTVKLPKRNPLKKGDVITFGLVIADPDAAHILRGNLLKSMLDGIPCNGFILRAISNGDVFKELDAANDLLEKCAAFLDYEAVENEKAAKLLELVLASD